MDAIVNMILGDSEFLDAAVIVRIIVFMFILEVFAAAAGLLGGTGRRR